MDSTITESEHPNAVSMRLSDPTRSNETSIAVGPTGAKLQMRDAAGDYGKLEVEQGSVELEMHYRDKSFVQLGFQQNFIGSYYQSAKGYKAILGISGSNSFINLEDMMGSKKLMP